MCFSETKSTFLFNFSSKLSFMRIRLFKKFRDSYVKIGSSLTAHLLATGEYFAFLNISCATFAKSGGERILVFYPNESTTKKFIYINANIRISSVVICAKSSHITVPTYHRNSTRPTICGYFSYIT